MEPHSKQTQAMLDLINECIKNENYIFLANLLSQLKTDYEELARLSTDGYYQHNWTHKQVLDYLTYEQKF